MNAIGYVRRSTKSDERTVSLEEQKAQVRARAYAALLLPVLLIVGCAVSPSVWKAHPPTWVSQERASEDWRECHAEASGLVADLWSGRTDYPWDPSFKWGYVTSFGTIGPQWGVVTVEPQDPRLPPGMFFGKPPVSRDVIADPMRRAVLTDEIVMLCLYQRYYRVEFSDGETFDKAKRGW